MRPDRLAATIMFRSWAGVSRGGPVVAMVVGALVLSACGSSGQASAPTVPTNDTTTPAAVAAASWDDEPPTATEDAAPSDDQSTAPAADLTFWSPASRAAETAPGSVPGPTLQFRKLPSAPTGLLPAVEIRRPVSLRIVSLDIDDAAIVDVGVESNGDFEVPSATEIGWYRFGPTPGAEGSAVLAAHIAADGVDGVFRNLADLNIGAKISVVYDDGTSADFQVAAMSQYAKEELPTDELFRKTGEPQLVLITCGGDFNPQVRSYDDNVVAIAVPIQ